MARRGPSESLPHPEVPALRALPLHPSRILLALCVALACWCAPQAARASWMIPGAPYRPKDFAIIKKDGVFHLFYIRNNVQMPLDATETDFGHAISNDLWIWQQLPPAFAIDAAGWDNLHVWAPHIVESDGLYWMFYTGVSDLPGEYNHTQRTGLAVSSDLMTWNRVGDEPIFSAKAVPWGWRNDASTQPAFRDPFVMRDPAEPSHWLMYYTGNLGTDTTATIVGVARSQGEIAEWKDVKPLLITGQAMTFNPVTESPHVFERNGLWYLFMTTSSGQPLSFYTTTTDPIGDPPAWTYRGRLATMLGYSTHNWFASEVLRDGTRSYFSFVSGDRIEFREILWGSGWQFSLVQPPFFHVKALSWVDSTVAEADTVALRITSVNYLSGQARVNAFAVDSLGQETPIPLDSLGIPSAIFVTADTSDFLWVAKRFPSTSDTTSVTRIRLRTTDETVVSDLITVGPPQPEPPPPPPPFEPPIGADPPEDKPFSGDRLWGAVRVPMGDRPAIVVELGHAAEARVSVHDLQGRVVRELASRRLPQGVSVLPWDGRDASGRRLSRGVYFVRAALGERTLTARIVQLD